MAVLGIDLGTSNTCACTIIDGQAQLILDERGNVTMPSVMALSRQGKFYIGHLAKAQLSLDPMNAIHSAKRLIGQPFDSDRVRKTLPYLSYVVVEDTQGMPLCQIGERHITPTEVSAAILKKVRTMAQQATGEEVREAMISVPAHFDNMQRKATKQAAEIAGLKVLRLINEPTAAVLAYGIDSSEPGCVGVYDFGGGTFDISILDFSDDIFNVLATGGDSFLGGNDFNHLIADHIMRCFEEKHGIDLRKDAIAKQRVFDASEWSKIQLSDHEEIEIELEAIVPQHDPSIQLRQTLSRSTIESLCRPLVEKSIDICNGVLDDCGMTIDDLDEIILIGGMTRMPMIRRHVEDWFSRKPYIEINPDEAVAIGAAYQANALVADDEELLLLDVTPLTLGIEAAGGIFVELIPKNSKVPTRVTRTFITYKDDQDSVIISVYQGEDRLCANNTLLGAFELTGLQKGQRTAVHIEVTFKIDVDGILNVTAVDEQTGIQRSIEIVDMARKALEDMITHEQSSQAKQKA